MSSFGRRIVRHKLGAVAMVALIGIAAVLALVVFQGAAQAACPGGPNFTIPAGDVATLICAIDKANDETNFPGLNTLDLTLSTYTLNALHNSDARGPNGLPQITSEIVINGNGSTIERDSGAPAFRIFSLPNSAGKLSLSDLRVTGGLAPSNDGGAIDSLGGAITLTNVTLDVNSASSGNGGAISRLGTAPVTISNSIIADNSANNGGGIQLQGLGTVNITGSTISGNSAVGSGGGINIEGTSENVTIIDTTIRDNDAASGGGMRSRGFLTMTGSTINNNSATNDGGGVRVFGIPVIRNSTISGNSGVLGWRTWGYPRPDAG